MPVKPAIEVLMAGGYTGKYCIVDLGSNKIEVIEPGEAFYKKYLAGYGRSIMSIIIIFEK